MAQALFVTDLDGTLLTDEQTISGEDWQTLVRLRGNGVVTAIATGRSYFSFARAMEELRIRIREIPVDFLIFSTGAGLMALPDETLIDAYSIPGPDIRKIMDFFDSAGFDYMVHKAIPDTPYFLYKSHGRENLDFWTRIQFYREFATPLNQHTRLFERATEVLAVVPERLGPEELERIRTRLSRFSVIHATSPFDHRSSWIEVFDKRVSKGLCVQRLAERLGIRRDQVTAVGNDYNDRDLLEWAGRGFLTANGAEDLGSWFRRVDSNNENGVSQAARKAGLLV